MVNAVLSSLPHEDRLAAIEAKLDELVLGIKTLAADTDLNDALRLMANRPFNHLPLVDADNKVVALATTKSVMKRTIDRMTNELDSLEAFLTADGIGG